MATTDDDDDVVVDVDESEDLIMVPAGFVTEMLGPPGDLDLLNAPGAQIIYSAPSPTKTLHIVPEPMLVELVNNNGPVCLLCHLLLPSQNRYKRPCGLLPVQRRSSTSTNSKTSRIISILVRPTKTLT